MDNNKENCSRSSKGPRRFKLPKPAPPYCGASSNNAINRSNQEEDASSMMLCSLVLQTSSKNNSSSSSNENHEGPFLKRTYNDEVTTTRTTTTSCDCCGRIDDDLFLPKNNTSGVVASNNSERKKNGLKSGGDRKVVDLVLLDSSSSSSDESSFWGISSSHIRRPNSQKEEEERDGANGDKTTNNAKSLPKRRLQQKETTTSSKSNKTVILSSSSSTSSSEGDGEMPSYSFRLTRRKKKQSNKKEVIQSNVRRKTYKINISSSSEEDVPKSDPNNTTTRNNIAKEVDSDSDADGSLMDLMAGLNLNNPNSATPDQRPISSSLMTKGKTNTNPRYRKGLQDLNFSSDSDESPNVLYDKEDYDDDNDDGDDDDTFIVPTDSDDDGDDEVSNSGFSEKELFDFDDLNFDIPPSSPVIAKPKKQVKKQSSTKFARPKTNTSATTKPSSSSTTERGKRLSLPALKPPKKVPTKTRSQVKSPKVSSSSKHNKENLQVGVPHRPTKKLTIAEFKKQRQCLGAETFARFNRMAFDGKLASVELSWSNRLNTTAGLTRLITVGRGTVVEGREAKVELATKVIDDMDRLEATLLHEMVHCATWLFEGKTGHGACFKKWANIAMRKIPGVVVTTTHSYEIEYKYAWACSNPNCSVVVKRHSRSVNVDRQVCGRCKSKLIEIDAPKRSEGKGKNSAIDVDKTPRKKAQPSAYNLFIKDNSKRVREKMNMERRALGNNSNVTQAEVMKECGRLWKERKAIMQP